jgi:hypothetical protein
MEAVKSPQSDLPAVKAPRKRSRNRGYHDRRGECNESSGFFRIVHTRFDRIRVPAEGKQPLGSFCPTIMLNDCLHGSLKFGDLRVHFRTCNLTVQSDPSLASLFWVWILLRPPYDETCSSQGWLGHGWQGTGRFSGRGKPFFKPQNRCFVPSPGEACEPIEDRISR